MATPADTRTEPIRELAPEELGAWRGLLRVHSALVKALDAELLAAHALPLTSYEVLINLQAAPGRRRRMAELADGVLLADLPGMSQDDVKIEFEDGTLTVSGERRAEHESKGEGYHRVERAFGAFSRSLTLPQGVDPEAVTASFNRGVLEVSIPKPEERKPRRIEIGGGQKTIEA